MLSWRLSNTLDLSFCLDVLQEALRKYGVPEIFNTDQGSHFTADGWVSILKEHGVQISMDGKGRALDNVYVERFWRTIKYEWIYL
ncbi:Integrase catalytic region, partial [mine drainage metagenome]